jgi:hypothetical protein
MSIFIFIFMLRNKKLVICETDGGLSSAVFSPRAGTQQLQNKSAEDDNVNNGTCRVCLDGCVNLDGR